jgi:hypothetical protein
MESWFTVSMTTFQVAAAPKFNDSQLQRAVDRSIAAENRRFLTDPEAVADARALGDLWRERLEEFGVLPRREGS